MHRVASLSKNVMMNILIIHKSSKNTQLAILRGHEVLKGCICKHYLN